MYIVLYIQHTQLLKNVHNYVHSMYTIYQIMKAILCIQRIHFLKNLHNFVYLMYTIFRRMYTNFSNNVYNSIHSM